MTIRISRDPVYRRRRFSAETIELCVRWYITYRLSYGLIRRHKARNSQFALDV
jgi:transposase-like protein